MHDKTPRAFMRSDFHQVSEWFTARGTTYPDLELFPTTGLIVDGIAAGFLYLTDTPLAFLDGFISNRETHQEERSVALNQIIEHLLWSAKQEHGCKLVKCDTQISAIKVRAKLHGFRELGSFDSFVKEL